MCAFKFIGWILNPNEAQFKWWHPKNQVGTKKLLFFRWSWANLSDPGTAALLICVWGGTSSTFVWLRPFGARAVLGLVHERMSQICASAAWFVRLPRFAGWHLRANIYISILSGCARPACFTLIYICWCRLIAAHFSLNSWYLLAFSCSSSEGNAYNLTNLSCLTINGDNKATEVW